MLIDFRKLFPKYGIKPKAILHVGANRGEEAPVYEELGIPQVSWIEANPNMMGRLREGISRYSNQQAFNFCIGDEDKETTLHISNNDSQSSSVLDLGTHRTAHPEVNFVSNIPMKMNRLDTLFNAGKLPTATMPDFLNADIQGAELMALKGLGNYLECFKWLYLEVNKESLYVGCCLVDELDEYLLKFGFKRVETKWCGNTGWGDALYIKEK